MWCFSFVSIRTKEGREKSGCVLRYGLQKWGQGKGRHARANSVNQSVVLGLVYWPRPIFSHINNYYYFPFESMIHIFLGPSCKGGTARVLPAPETENSSRVGTERIRDSLQMEMKHLRPLLLRGLNSHARILNAGQRRDFSVWSSPKDPALEAALSRNRRWIVNNQIKNIILRYPDQTPPVKFIQKKFKTLDLQGKALNWLKKYPCCFEVFCEGDENYCRLTKRMMSLVEEEESVQSSREPLLVQKLAKVLLLSRNHRLNVVKLNEFKRNFGFPDDYLIRIVPKYPEMFRIVNHSGRRTSMEIEIVACDPEFKVSVIEAKAREMNAEPRFTCCLPMSWEKSWRRFEEFNEKLPYISPYTSAVLDEEIMEKRAVALVHELLALMLWKKGSIVKLGHFKREFALPEKMNTMLLRHPGIFYVSNRYQIYTVVLREGYSGSELIEKDPLVLVKEKFGELMQEGIHEYNRRRCQANLDKKRVRGLLKVRSNAEMSEDDMAAEQAKEVYKPEERKRFYKVLFDDNATWE